MCPKEGQRSIMNKYRKGFYGILLLTLTMLFGMTAQAKTDDTIKTGIYAGDVELSGMTAQEATAVIEEHIESLKDVEITLLAANDHDVTTTAGDLNVSDLTNKDKGDYAYSLLDLDSAIDASTVEKLSAIDGVLRVRVIK